jgi:hypothetical protein
MPSTPRPPTPARPRRTPKTPARRAAVLPSSAAPARASASASKVTKRVRTAAERKSDTAVTAGLVRAGLSTRARSVPAAAAAQEVAALDATQQHVEPVATAPAVFRYSAQWFIRHPRDGQLQADSEHQTSDATDEAIAKANAFIDRGVSEHPNYMLLRKQLIAGYAGLAERNWVPGSFTPEAYSRLVEHMQEWHAEGKRLLTLKVTATMRDVTMEDVTGEPVIAAASTSRVRNAATPRARNATTPAVRNTATNRALAAMPDEQDIMEVGGNWASAITARWTCSQKSCAFHQKGCCYWTIRDEAINHVPVIAAVLISWAEGIRDRELTAASPTQEMYGLMVAAKYEHNHGQIRGGGGKGAPIVNVNNHYPAPPLVSRSPTSSSRANPKNDSSPMRMPSDPPELSTIEALDAFFAWCKTDRGWITEHARLDEILLLLKANGDSVYTMANCSYIEWKDINVANGYRKRLKMSAKLWINSGMPIVNRTTPPAGASA